MHCWLIELMWSNFNSFTIPSALIGIYITWKIYPLFVSISEKIHENRITLFASRVMISLMFGGFLGVMILGAFASVLYEKTCLSVS